MVKLLYLIPLLFVACLRPSLDTSKSEFTKFQRGTSSYYTCTKQVMFETHLLYPHVKQMDSILRAYVELRTDSSLIFYHVDSDSNFEYSLPSGTLGLIEESISLNYRVLNSHHFQFLASLQDSFKFKYVQVPAETQINSATIYLVSRNGVFMNQLKLDNDKIPINQESNNLLKAYDLRD